MINRNSLLKIFLPLVSALSTVFLIELILILFYPIPYSFERNMYFEPDPYLGYRHRPLSSGTYPNFVPAEANSLGFRDDEITLEKPSNTFRILMLGDSFTVGANVEQSNAYPQVLERLLNIENTNPIEVVNAAVGGYEPFHYAEFVDNYADKYNPDMLLLGFFVGNDAYNAVHSFKQTRTAVLGRRVNRYQGKGWPILIKVWAYENLHVFRAVVNTGPKGMQFEREECNDFSKVYLAVQEKRITNHLANPGIEKKDLLKSNINQLERIQKYAKARDIPFMIVLLPDETQLNSALQEKLILESNRDQYDFDMPQKTLRDNFDRLQIINLDLIDDFRKDSRCLYMNDTHWITEGHRLAAEVIQKELLARKLIPSGSKRNK
ncbi:MAG: SGNH/GDSL hydrolase family protein [Pseudomonadota bacterium]|nr:SGNH/GDSL hydrolase family protein [Pseudomonadota bacterium]